MSDFRQTLQDILVCTVCGFPLIKPTTLQCGNSVCQSCKWMSLPLIAWYSSQERPHSNIALQYCVCVCTVVNLSTYDTNLVPRFLISSNALGHPIVIAPERLGNLRVTNSLDIMQRHITLFATNTVECEDNQVSIHNLVDISADLMKTLDIWQRIDEILKCSICLNIFHKPRTLPCGHSFCKVCIESLYLSSWYSSCPCCKRNISSLPSHSDKSLQKCINLLAQVEQAITAKATNLYIFGLSAPNGFRILLALSEPVYTVIIPKTTCKRIVLRYTPYDVAKTERYWNPPDSSIACCETTPKVRCMGYHFRIFMKDLHSTAVYYGDKHKVSKKKPLHLILNLKCHIYK